MNVNCGGGSRFYDVSNFPLYFKMEPQRGCINCLRLPRQIRIPRQITNISTEASVAY